MKPQSIANLLKNKVHNVDTIVNWDEFRKLVSVGETLKSGPDELVITQKIFEETGEGLKISLYAESR